MAKYVFVTGGVTSSLGKGITAASIGRLLKSRGLSVSIITGAVYAAGLSVGSWLNHVDIAHLLMGLSFWLMVRGCPFHVAAPREYLVAWPSIRRIADTAAGGS